MTGRRVARAGRRRALNRRLCGNTPTAVIGPVPPYRSLAPLTRSRHSDLPGGAVSPEGTRFVQPLVVASGCSLVARSGQTRSVAYVAAMDRPGWLYYVAAALFVIAGLIVAIPGDRRVVGIFVVVIGVLLFVYARMYAKK